MKLKEFKIDLGGSFPSKSEAVQRHAFELGYIWWSSYKGSVENTEARYLYFNKDMSLAYSRGVSKDSHKFFCNESYEEVTAEKFLELTKEDVVMKGAELYYRYRIWFKNGDILESNFYLKEKDGSLFYITDTSYCEVGKIVKLERIGEGVAKVSDQV